MSSTAARLALGQTAPERGQGMLTLLRPEILLATDGTPAALAATRVTARAGGTLGTATARVHGAAAGPCHWIPCSRRCRRPSIPSWARNRKSHAS